MSRDLALIAAGINIGMAFVNLINGNYPIIAGNVVGLLIALQYCLPIRLSEDKTNDGN